MALKDTFTTKQGPIHFKTYRVVGIFGSTWCCSCFDDNEIYVDKLPCPRNKCTAYAGSNCNYLYGHSGWEIKKKSLHPLDPIGSWYVVAIKLCNFLPVAMATDDRRLPRTQDQCIAATATTHDRNYELPSCFQTWCIRWSDAVSRVIQTHRKETRISFSFLLVDQWSAQTSEEANRLGWNLIFFHLFSLNFSQSFFLFHHHFL